MSTSRLRLAFSVCFVALSCGITLPLAGCGSGNPNETEFPLSAREALRVSRRNGLATKGTDFTVARKDQGREGGRVEKR